VILVDETLRQRVSHGISITIPKARAQQEMIPLHVEYPELRAPP